MPRAGLAFKQGVVVPAGVIDPAYQGQLIVLLSTLLDEPQTIERNRDVAQLVLLPRWGGGDHASYPIVRGETGFGSSDDIDTDSPSDTMGHGIA